MSATPDATAHDGTRNPVQEVRKALGLSQEHMAVKLGCTKACVANWEHLGTLPHRDNFLVTLQRLAKQAGIEIEL
jgi:DNA-binding transcriptional regulator YiaG